MLQLITQKIRSNVLLKGTLLLTAAGLLTKILGFFYRIFLSRLIGAVNLGIYQMIFPVFGICFTLYGAGIQTTISKLVAEDERKNARQFLKAGCILSFLIACTLSLLLFTYSDEIARHLLKEASCSGPLKILSLLFPFCSIASCINGYYYGKKKALVPSMTQVVEQVLRILAVYILSIAYGKDDTYLTCEIAVWGLVAGELASFLFNLLSLSFEKKQTAPSAIRKRSIIKRMLTFSIPLTSTRLMISVISSVESILIPYLLRKYGLSPSDALATLGILTGMALPFIMFPSTIPNSMAVMLLPSVSEANARNDDHYLAELCQKSIGLCTKIGIMTTAGFLLFGNDLGICFFNNESAGVYITILSWISPFLYLAITMSSILNGLGKTALTFRTSFLCSLIRLGFIYFMIPQKGIYGYLIGLLISQLTSVLLYSISLKKMVRFSVRFSEDIIKPAAISATGYAITILLKKLLGSTGPVRLFELVFYGCFFLLVTFVLFILFYRENSKEQP